MLLQRKTSRIMCIWCARGQTNRRPSSGQLMQSLPQLGIVAPLGLIAAAPQSERSPSAGPRPNARRDQRRFSASCHNRLPETDNVSPVLPVSSRVRTDVAPPFQRCGATSACGNAWGHASPRSPEVRERWLPFEELLSERSGRQHRARTIDPGKQGQPDARDLLAEDIGSS
jgi:hypothetical protein